MQVLGRDLGFSRVVFFAEFLQKIPALSLELGFKSVGCREVGSLGSLRLWEWRERMERDPWEHGRGFTWRTQIRANLTEQGCPGSIKGTILESGGSFQL